MGILVCRRRWLVCYKHPDPKALFNLTHIEMDLGSVCVLDINHINALDIFTDYELKCMYYGMVGTKYEGYNSENLKQNIKALLELLPDSTLDSIRLQMQADQILDDDTSCYRYDPNSYKALTLEEEYEAPSMVITKPFEQIRSTYDRPEDTAANKWPFHGCQPQADINSPRRQPRIADGPAAQPSSGSKTGRVWEIAEELWVTHNNTTDWKSFRPHVIGACEAQGINSSTASVQYGKWKSTKI